jgi:hypothetical protein
MKAKRNDIVSNSPRLAGRRTRVGAFGGTENYRDFIFTQRKAWRMRMIAAAVVVAMYHRWWHYLSYF